MYGAVGRVGRAGLWAMLTEQASTPSSRDHTHARRYTVLSVLCTILIPYRHASLHTYFTVNTVGVDKIYWDHRFEDLIHLWHHIIYTVPTYCIQIQICTEGSFPATNTR